MLLPRRTLFVLSSIVVLAACGNPDAAPSGDQPPAPPAAEEATDDPGASTELPADATAPASAGADQADEGSAPVDIRIVDGELVLTHGGRASGWSLPSGEFHSALVRPDSTPAATDAVVLVLEGEQPVLYHLYSRAELSGIERFPDHLQPIHEVDASPPVLAFTPDGNSLVWTEPTGDGVVLRTIGWDGGPGTSRPADDNASFELDAPADVHVDGFEVAGDGAWTLLLRPGSGGDPLELRIDRQSDGALALPAQ